MDLLSLPERLVDCERALEFAEDDSVSDEIYFHLKNESKLLLSELIGKLISARKGSAEDMVQAIFDAEYYLCSRL